MTVILGVDANVSDGATALVKSFDELRKGISAAQAVTLAGGLEFPAYTAAGILLLEHAARATTQGTEDRAPFFQAARHVLMNASFEQIKHVKKPFLYVCRQFAEDACSVGAPMMAVRPLQAVLAATAGSQWALTSVHTDFLQVCLAAKAYKVASSVTSTDVFEVESDKQLYNAEDYVRYWLYAGMVAIGLKQWETAIDALRNCITTPATALSAVVIEAFKKFVLVSLIARGNVAELPRYTPAVVTHNKEHFASPYLLLAEAFGKFDDAALLKIATDSKAAFDEDKNFGLVKQAVSSLTRRKVQRLTDFYVTVSLADIAKNVSMEPAEAESLVVEMIGTGEICASVDQARGMVTFHDSPDSYASPAALARLNAEVGAAMKLSERLRVVDEEMQMDDRYVRRSILMERRGSGAAGAGGMAGMPGQAAMAMAMGMGGPGDM